MFSHHCILEMAVVYSKGHQYSPYPSPNHPSPPLIPTLRICYKCCLFMFNSSEIKASLIYEPVGGYHCKLSATVACFFFCFFLNVADHINTISRPMKFSCQFYRYKFKKRKTKKQNVQISSTVSLNILPKSLLLIQYLYPTCMLGYVNCTSFVQVATQHASSRSYFSFYLDAAAILLPGNCFYSILLFTTV